MKQKKTSQGTKASLETAINTTQAQTPPRAALPPCKYRYFVVYEGENNLKGMTELTMAWPMNTYERISLVANFIRKNNRIKGPLIIVNFILL